jgi:chorismate dehydratase
LGAISFLNTIPVYYPFHLSVQTSSTGLPQVEHLPVNTELTYAPPSALNEMMRQGDLDVSPVSSAFYLRHQEQFELLSDLSVSSFGSVDSVILLSKLPFGPRLLELESIGVPDSSETSIALLTHLLLAELGEDALKSRLASGWLQLYPAQEHQEALKTHQAILMIGDDALRRVEESALRRVEESALRRVEESALRRVQESTQANTSQPLVNQASDYFTYDLATLWREKTELPFVFAVWVAQKNWASENPTAFQSLNAFLRDARIRFFRENACLQNGIDLAKQSSVLSEAALRHYFTESLDYQLQSEHLQALTRFGNIINTLDQQGYEVSLRKTAASHPNASPDPIANPYQAARQENALRS